ncbi:MAG: DUF2283 domain-containing protein [Nitrososphaerales archaeon]
MQRKYKVKLPSKVTMVDYDEEEGDLYIRFREAEYTEGEPTEDGLVIFHYSDNRIAALEIMDVVAF